jgi:UDP-N-acetylmuramoyl-L-alanyl-D-glutamate--2,6-diaminopimelate ligase
VTSVKRRCVIKAADLINILSRKEVFGAVEQNVAKIEYDSRLITPEDLFVAFPGAKFDGHDFIEDAIKAGASVIVCEKDFDSVVPCKIIVPDGRHALGLLAGKFYGYPSRKMKLVGITGTNGKTTTVYMIRSIFESRGKKTGLMGTIEYLAGQYQFEAFNTTPESLHIERLLSLMRSEGIRNVVMEVSSHALKMGRVRMIDFNVVGFTNLTQDHLDYHKTMDSYRESKAILFEKVKGKEKWAVLNMDDPNYDYFLSHSECSYLAYSINNPKADLHLENIEKVDDGYTFKLITPLGNEDIHLKLSGFYNLSNALCAAASAMAAGVDAGTLKRGLEAISSVSGRLEKVNCGQDFEIFVDYAHTPDALDNVLKSARELAGDKKLIALFGCGGDRDKEKRPMMAEAASKYADIIVLTSDNPRTEDPEQIIYDAKKGLDPDKESLIVVDRKEAIAQALSKASVGDIVVIAGKGHETYQIIGNKKEHFDDREVIRDALKG